MSPLPASSRVASSARRRTTTGGFAAAGLVIIVVGMCVLAAASSLVAGHSARAASHAAAISRAYRDAADDVTHEERLADSYRHERTLATRGQFERTADKLEAHLVEAKVIGNASDHELVGDVLALHSRYRAAVVRLFDAVDREDEMGILTISQLEAAPVYDKIERQVLDAASSHGRVSTAALDRLITLDARAARTLPVVLLGGLLAAGMLLGVLRWYRAALDDQRDQSLHDSLHDRLTSLPNRVLLAERFSSALRANRRDRSSSALLLLDLDRFKEINDTLGHHHGDALLRQIGPRLSGALREVDTVARLGGDEFAVLLPKVDGVLGAEQVAERLRLAFADPFLVDGVELDVEASVGIAVSGVHGEDAATLLQRADVAMYVAKAQGLGVFVYDAAMDGHSPERLSILGDLRRGLERHELTLHYQPKVSLSTGDVVGVEGLLRWEHPERGMIMPDTFIPLAEHTGLIGPLTRYVLDVGLSQARAWLDAGTPLPVAVNLSARNLVDESLPQHVAMALVDHGVPAHLLELEVTESALISEPLRAASVLTRLRALGVRVAVDDFGAGYTSLSELRSLPVTELKIDRMFVTPMAKDRGDLLIVRSVIDLGHNLGLTVIAEGVEDADTMNALRALGCDVAQGYHLSRPMPASEVPGWVTTWSRDRAMERH